MKMSFPLGGEAASFSLPADYRTLIAGIVGRQSVSRTAAVAARLVSAAPAVAIVEALSEIILARRARPEAGVLKGSFHPTTAITLAVRRGQPT